MSKLKEAIEKKDWLTAKRLILDNPKYLEENVDLVLGMVKEYHELFTVSERVDKRQSLMFERMQKEGGTVYHHVMSQFGKRNIQDSFIDLVNSTGLLPDDLAMVKNTPVNGVNQDGSPAGESKEFNECIQEVIAKKEYGISLASLRKMYNTPNERIDKIMIGGYALKKGQMIDEHTKIADDCEIDYSRLERPWMQRLTLSPLIDIRVHDKELAHEQAIRINDFKKGLPKPGTSILDLMHPNVQIGDEDDIVMLGLLDSLKNTFPPPEFETPVFDRMMLNACIDPTLPENTIRIIGEKNYVDIVNIDSPDGRTVFFDNIKGEFTDREGMNWSHNSEMNIGHTEVDKNGDVIAKIKITNPREDSEKVYKTATQINDDKSIVSFDNGHKIVLRKEHKCEFSQLFAALYIENFQVKSCQECTDNKRKYYDCSYRMQIDGVHRGNAEKVNDIFKKAFEDYDSLDIDFPDMRDNPTFMSLVKLNLKRK